MAFLRPQDISRFRQGSQDGDVSPLSDRTLLLLKWGSQDRTGSPLAGYEHSSDTRVAGISTRRRSCQMEPVSPHPQTPRQLVTPHSDRAPLAGLASPLRHLVSPQVSQLEPVRREGELWNIRAQAGLSVVAIMAVDIFFHFFYILTIPSDLKFASRLPDSALGECTGSRSGTGNGPLPQEDEPSVSPRPHGWGG